MERFHSEPVQEIMGTIPSWITRWGVTIIFSILVLILVGCCVIRYPETVVGKVELVSSNPPADLVARQSGLIDSLFVRNGYRVGTGGMVAVITSSAVLDNVLEVEAFLKSGGCRSIETAIESEIFTHDLQLGVMQPQWTDICSVVREYSDHVRLDLHGARKSQLVRQRNELKEQQSLLQAQKEILYEDFAVQESALNRDSRLYDMEAITLSEYESSRQTYLSKLNGLRAFEASMQGFRITGVQLDGELQSIDLEHQEQLQNFRRRYAQTVISMEASLAAWKETYALVAPHDGTVSMPAFWDCGQYVASGETVASVVPVSSDTCTGRAKITSSGLGKVREGQVVKVQLNGFPYMEFGIVRGTVSYVSPVPERSQDGNIMYALGIQFPEGLRTTYGKELPFIQGMDGSVEIITDNRTLMMTIVGPVRAILTNRWIFEQ